MIHVHCGGDLRFSVAYHALVEEEHVEEDCQQREEVAVEVILAGLYLVRVEGARRLVLLRPQIPIRLQLAHVAGQELQRELLDTLEQTFQLEESLLVQGEL